MANSYTQFSTCIGLENEDERNWWLQRMESWDQHHDEDPDPEFNWKPTYEIEQNAVYLWDMDWMEPERMATVFQEFLSHFNNSKYIRMEYSFVCDKPRPGEFGGGVAIITKDDIFWMHTGSWLPDEVKYTDTGEVRSF